jgi:MmpS family membrane protein
VSQRSTGMRVLARTWLPLVTVIAVGVGALCMWKVHQASAPGPVLAVNGPQAPEEFVPKSLTYELDGDLGDGGMLSYIDIDGHPHTVDLSSLPWSHTETTTLTVVSGSISAQVHGGSVHCRMLVNDVVRDDQSATRDDADVTCRVKSA